MLLKPTNASNMANGTHGCLSGDCVQSDVYPPQTMYVVLLAGCIVFTLNIPVVVTVIFTKVKSSNFVYLHILSLGLTDASVGLALVCSAAIKLFSKDQENYWSCRSRIFIMTVINTCSAFQVSVISLDRLLLVRSAAWKSITKNLSLLIKIVLGTFLVALTVNAIPFITLQTFDFSEQCTLSNIFKEKLSVSLMYYGILYISLLMFDVFCTCTNIGNLWRHKKRRQRMNTGVERVTKETRGMITLSIITSLHIVTTAPSAGYCLVHGLSGEDIVPATCMLLLSLGCLCSACNPVVYSFRIPEMREALKFIWRKVCRKGRQDSYI